MQEYRSEILKRVSKSELYEQLLLESFDGIVLIDLSADRVIQINDDMTGKLTKYMDFDNRTYSENMKLFVESSAPSMEKSTLMQSLDIEAIRRKLKSRKTYTVDFYTISRPNGQKEYKRVCFRALDDVKDIVVLACEDISDIILSDIDPLTGLYDSNGFHKHVRKWISEHPGRKFRIQRYDIDRFKDINGVYGYDMGNRLLQDCGYHMKSHDTPDSFSAHLNADHFVRFCSDDSLTSQEYYDGFVEAFKGYELKIPIAIHMGVYELCEPDCDSYTMSYKALLALQSSKGKFNTPIAYYEKGMMDIELEHREFLNDVDSAIEHGEFEVWFQPQIDYANKRLAGAEALIRWKHPVRGLVSPGEYIPIFESSAKICDLDRYMINETCRYIRSWMNRMPEIPIVVSVNLSRIDVKRERFAEKLRAIVDGYKIPVSSLRLEITESAYMENAKMLIDVVKQLRNEGFIIEMDDFGSGFSSLNTLKDIDIDVLKLDMNFLAVDSNTERSRIIISSVIRMASELGIPVIAEGVETKEQAEMLAGFGCNLMQGYYFSKPVPADEYEKMLKKAYFEEH